jgi:hypothetical protein
MWTGWLDRDCLWQRFTIESCVENFLDAPVAEIAIIHCPRTGSFQTLNAHGFF